MSASFHLHPQKNALHRHPHLHHRLLNVHRHPHLHHRLLNVHHHPHLHHRLLNVHRHPHLNHRLLNAHHRQSHRVERELFTARYPLYWGHRTNRATYCRRVLRTLR
ncbi:hypothetical protein V8G54_027944 [Vigna mungo]|uniref:Uncharacterized protein n=1 Tax=Vigna mungo TaxID=3915 RepID=A0AAQ3RHQ7_VIGMU